jgi:hypothetical protein
MVISWDGWWCLSFVVHQNRYDFRYGNYISTGLYYSWDLDKTGGRVLGIEKISGDLLFDWIEKIFRKHGERLQLSETSKWSGLIGRILQRESFHRALEKRILPVGYGWMIGVVKMEVYITMDFVMIFYGLLKV